LASHEGRRNREPEGPAEAGDSRTQGGRTTSEWARQSHTDTLVLVHVHPGGRKTLVSGVHGGRLKISLSAPPVDGKANEALLDLLAELLHRPRRQLHLESGPTSRDKTVRVEAADAVAVARELMDHIAKAKRK
jgi:uncharacterized protein (TIGR00251 family)